jgi:uncharacterized protein YybS (DUF2232 family)
MRPIFSKISSVAVLAAVGGGLASALLSMLTVQKTSLALAMGCISPLPVMLAALAFGSIPGFVAAVVGALAVGLFDVRQGGLVLFRLSDLNAAGMDVLVYAVSLGLPSWMLARIASSTRISGATVPAADQRKLGLVVGATAGFAVIGVTLDFATTVVNGGGFKATIDAMTQRIEPYIETLFTTGRQLPNGITVHELAVAMTYAQMPILAAASVVLLGFNIWAAARIAKASGHFRAPWPDLPRSLRVPRALALVLAVSLGLSLAGGLPGLLALIVTGALIMAFAAQGLAVIHDVTRGKSYRLPLLIIVYLSLAMLMPWLLAIYALVGLGDAGFSFRDRRVPAATGKL